MKFCQNLQFLTFIFVAEISNQHFCELSEILRNFPTWQTFVFVTVIKMLGFVICNFKQWSCDVLEGYCTRLSSKSFQTERNHTFMKTLTNSLIGICFLQKNMPFSTSPKEPLHFYNFPGKQIQTI